MNNTPVLQSQITTSHNLGSSDFCDVNLQNVTYPNVSYLEDLSRNRHVEPINPRLNLVCSSDIITSSPKQIKQRTRCQKKKLVDPSEIMDIPHDAYDNTSDEQKFCGGYNEWGHVVNKTERTILPDLSQYPFPDDIKLRADAIYNKMIYRVRRGGVRSKLLFFCVYSAYLEIYKEKEDLGQKENEKSCVDPMRLGKIFGLTSGDVQKCFSLFSPLQTGYKPPTVYAQPEGYFPDYCKGFGLDVDAIREIIELSRSVLKKDKTLLQENPQTVAAGFLRYYTITNGIVCDDPQKIIQITNRSVATIDSMCKKIAMIDNQYMTDM